MKKLTVLILHDGRDKMPDEKSFSSLGTLPEWNTEISVYKAIKLIGHDVRFLAFNDDVGLLMREINAHRPDIVFNLAESSLGEYRYDRNIPALLELLKLPYTGCGPSGLMVCNNKALTKKILKHHDILTPRFGVFRIGEPVKFPKSFNPPPYIVKPLKEEASVGISQESIVEKLEQCVKRVQFIHEGLRQDAIVEEFIEGRELYVSIIGRGKNLKMLPVWEMKFTNIQYNEPKIATFRAKWDANYRKKWGIKNEFAGQLPAGVEDKIADICKKSYKVLNLDGYARFDLRLTPIGTIYLIEANANPELAKGEDFASSALKAGITYDYLIEEIIQHGLSRVSS